MKNLLKSTTGLLKSTTGLLKAMTGRPEAFKASAHAVAALVLTLAALTATTGPATAAPQPMGRCTTTSGVVLAVDFGHWGGPVLRSCGTTPTTGYELLNQGGWQTTGTGHDGPAFICRIGYSGHRSGTQYPTAAEDDCVLTPPASAYWSYWHADPGADDWQYSQLGAMLYEPKPGSVDLWIFGGTDTKGTEGRPTVTPGQLRAHNTRPQSDPNPPPSKAPADSPSPKRNPQPQPKPQPQPNSQQAQPSSPSPSPTPTPTPTPPTKSPQPSAQVVDAAPTAGARHDSGSLTPVLTGAALVLLIAGAAAYEARRRRRRTE